MAKPSEKSEDQLAEDRAERQKVLEEKANLDIEEEVFGTDSKTHTEKTRAFNKWYKAIRKGSVILLAKKKTTDEIDEVILEAQEFTQKIAELLE